MRIFVCIVLLTFLVAFNLPGVSRSASILSTANDKPSAFQDAMRKLLSLLGVVLITISGWLGGEMVFKHGVAVDSGSGATPENVGSETNVLVKPIWPRFHENWIIELRKLSKSGRRSDPSAQDLVTPYFAKQVLECMKRAR